MKKIACILYEEGKTIKPDLAIKSVYDHVDKIVIVNGSKSKLHKKDIVKEEGKKIVKLYNPYDHESKGGNGKQRNVYLNYLKKHHLGTLD